MLAIVTSIGEPTTDLCIWALERQGFTVDVYNEPSSSLWEKLKFIYITTQTDFLRIDADVIVNRNCTPQNIAKMVQDGIWWQQYLTYSWFQQDVTHGGVQFVRKEAIPYLRKQIDEAKYKERPESYMYRIAPFHNPRRCITQDVLMGLHGFAQDDIQRVKDIKERRGQMSNYDFELAERLNELYNKD